MNKLLKVGLIGLVALLSVGCKTVTGTIKSYSKGQEEGVIYGSAGIPKVTAREACKAINNKDPRCENADKYHLVSAISKFGFQSAAWGGYALIEKTHPSVEVLSYVGAISDKEVPFVKMKLNKGRFGDVLDVVSTNGDGKCKWTGFNKHGGVVCEAYNYDYRKDYKGFNF